jgi:hypothetical protein
MRDEWLTPYYYPSVPAQLSITQLRDAEPSTYYAARTCKINMFGTSDNQQWGMLATGDPAESAIQDCQVAVALRLPTGSVNGANKFFGLVMRAQSALTGSISSGSRSYYIVGLNSSTTSSANPSCIVRKWTAGTAAVVGSAWTMPTTTGNWLHYEVKILNNGANVEFWTRHNTSSTPTTYGSANWSSYTLRATDTSPGVLANPGYYGIGFGQLATTAWGGGTYGNNYIQFDYFRLRI